MAHIVLTLLRLRCLGVRALLTLVLPLFIAPAAAGQAPNEVTYAKHVAPIIQQKCQVCHQPNSIGPMPLTNYEEVVKAARRIKGRVVARVMPPWHIDKNVGIRDFKNDRSLTDEQIETIVRWVDNGTPLGDPRDMPPAPVFPDPTGWQLEKDFGKPDLILKSPPFTLAARTPGLEYDFAQLTTAAAEIVRRRWPDKGARPDGTSEVILVADADIPYHVVVATMDAVRQHPDGTLLFPDVLFSTGL